MDSILVFEGEPNNDGHRCFGPGCPGCKTPRPKSRIASWPDSTPPNHDSMEPGHPRCNSKRRLQARSTLHKKSSKRLRASSMSHVLKCAFQLGVSSYESVKYSSLSDSSSRVAGSISHSEPEPPHKCIMFPCNVCGKGKSR